MGGHAKRLLLFGWDPLQYDFQWCDHHMTSVYDIIVWHYHMISSYGIITCMFEFKNLVVCAKRACLRGRLAHATMVAAAANRLDSGVIITLESRLFGRAVSFLHVLRIKLLIWRIWRSRKNFIGTHGTDEIEHRSKILMHCVQTWLHCRVKQMLSHECVFC